MKTRLALCLGLLQLSWYSFAYPANGPTLGQILLRLADQVKEFEFSLPDFVCKERITSGEVVAGYFRQQVFFDSVFIGTQNKDEQGRPFTESREIKTIDGREAEKGRQPEVPFFFGGGFSSVLDATFGGKNIPYHTYKLAGTETIDDRPALVIKFATKDGQKDVSFEFLGSRFISRDTGTAWIDPESMRVVRLERRYLNVPPPYGVVTVSIEYSAVVLNGKTFWMPKTVVVEETQNHSRKPVGARYIAEYSDYQKFDVSTRIKY